MAHKDVNHNEDDLRHIDEFHIIKQEVETWLKDNNLHEHEQVAFELLESTYRGTFERVSFDHLNTLNTKPDWLEVEKLETGQRFARDFYLPIASSELITLLLGLSNDNVISKLIFTGRSSTPYTSFKRYLSTGNTVRSWFTSDLLDPNSKGCKNISRVNAVHRHFYNDFLSTNSEELIRRVTLKDAKPNLCPYIVKDMNKTPRNFDFNDVATTHHPLTQTEMFATQFSFLGLMISEPEKFGVCPIKYREGLEGFIHLWKYLGYRLGVNEKYNLCSGNYEQVIVKCKVFTDFILKRNLYNADARWEHMTRCIIEGMQYNRKSLSYESHLLFGLYIINLKCDEFYNQCSIVQKIEFFIMKTIHYYLMPYDWFRSRITDKVLKEIDEISNNIPTEDEFNNKCGFKVEYTTKSGINEKTPNENHIELLCQNQFIPPQIKLDEIEARKFKYENYYTLQ